MFDLQTHLLPTIAARNCAAWPFAWAMPTRPSRTALDAFRADYKQKTELNRKNSRSLAARRVRRGRQAGAGSRSGARSRSAAGANRRACWADIRFTTCTRRYQNLMALSRRAHPLSLHAALPAFSGRRSRRDCLPAIADTPDPDQTLVNLSKVSESLGGKGVLWELFSFNPPVAAHVRRAVRVEPVPVEHSDQQSRA